MRFLRLRSASRLLVAGSVVCPCAWAGILQDKEFSAPDLSMSSSNVAASRFLEATKSATPVFIDARSGAITGAVLRVPLIPGSGAGNHLKLQHLAVTLGRPVAQIEGKVVGDLVRDLIVTNRVGLGIDVAQLGSTKAAQVNDELWQVSIPQQVEGIPVRGGRVLATISHGNLVLLGTEKWGNAVVDTAPSIRAEDAVAAGLEYVGGAGCKDAMWKPPTLEILPFAPGGFDAGYGHRLVWTFGFTRADEPERWELIVDAHDKRVLALADTVLADSRRISGGVYPLTSTGVCATSEFCGTMQSDWPMAYTDTGLPPPNDYTNGAGLYDHPGDGVAATTLNGKYVRVGGGCGPIYESSATGDIDLGGFAGQHDCASAGSAGNTAPARTAFYHLNKTIEAARGWLPFNPWLSSPFPIEVHVPGFTCSANYVPGTTGYVRFYQGLEGQCLGSAEIATVINHEWGHGLDDHDLVPIGSFGEAYADLNAIFRSQVSCLYYGFKYGVNEGCGFTPDGTGKNANEVIEGRLGFFHCDLQCSGHRDVDWERHLDPGPDTPQDFSCLMCGTGGVGPCGGEVHCGARPVVQAAWDFATRDLRAAPFGLSRTDAFVVASKLYYQGSANLGDWHACDCAAGTSDGCAASSAYMQWLAADDSDGNLSNGTPHAGAIRTAFERHNVGCPEMAPASAGCVGGPTLAPTLVAAAGMNRVDLSWDAVAGATRYRVLRTEGQAGCDMGKAVIAETAGLGYADTALANGRSYYYVVHAVGASGACFGPSGDCRSATPVHCAGTISLVRSQMDCEESASVTLEDWDLRGAGSASLSVVSTTEPTPEAVALTETPPASGRFTGTIATTSGPASHGDGAISIVHGDALRLGYLDASRCGTVDVPFERSVPIDCRAPVITNVHAVDVAGTSEIRWNTDEPATSQIAYGPAAPPDHGVGPSSAFVTSHAVQVGDLARCARAVFSVSSTDRLGHQSTDDRAGEFYSFTTAPDTSPTLVPPGLPRTIPPGNAPSGTRATVLVSDAEVVTHVKVKTSIAIALTQHLQLALIGPDQTTVLLSSYHGNFAESDYVDTVFDDDAPTAIADAHAPYTGSFRPDQPLAAFNGKIAQGEWTLRILHAGFDPFYTGTLEELELELTYPPRTCGPSIALGSQTSSDSCQGASAGEGNTIVEPGETIELSIQVTNTDAEVATGIWARLEAFTPGIFVTRATSTYADLAPGSSAQNATPFELYVDPALDCGTPFVLRLAGSSNEGGWVALLPMRVGEQVPALSESFNNTAKSIPDLSTARSFIGVTDSWVLTDVDVSLSINHAAPTDLDVFLVAPDGTRVELTTDNGGSFASGYTDTVFDDEAATAITAGNAPFTGRFRPESPLSVLDGKLSEGAWTLEVTDDRLSVAGTLVRWSLSLTHLIVLPCTTCPLSELPAEVPWLSWSGTAKDTLEWSATPRASNYVLHRGVRSQLPALLHASVDSCERLETTLLASGASLTESPSLGSFFWFLVRAENSIGAGSAGNATTAARVLNASDSCQ